MKRIAETFERLSREGRLGLVPFLPVGYPSPEETLRLVPALVAGGADIVELGIPFSDPLADGVTVQRASYQALCQGMTPARCLEVVARLRREGLAVPLVLMGYYNSILAWGREGHPTAWEPWPGRVGQGVDGFVQGAREAGADGLIVVDLPAEEAEPLWRACAEQELAFIPLLAPTSSDERIAMSARVASGFLYCVSLTGVTGARQRLAPELADFLARVRRHSPLPRAVGFGISQREHVEEIGRLAEAAVVGSALIDAIEGVADDRRAERAKAFLEGLALR
ncbi:MAG TPA: tryptophan synthase subunit alpha [Dehalococcoidia bacterium]|nr:tryptophan synthase subunit alpha [Dehalococcoidia bacterium]